MSDTRLDLPRVHEYRQNVTTVQGWAWQPEHGIGVFVLVENAVDFLAVVVQQCQVADNLYQPPHLSFDEKLVVLVRFSV